MLLKPKKTKYVKIQRGRLSRVVSSFRYLKGGSFGIISQESIYLTPQQIESARKVISRYLKRKSRILINVFPDFSLTVKPAEMRMGKGKGNVKSWVCRIKKGSVIFEAISVEDKQIYQAFQAAQKKLPMRTFIFRCCYKNKKN